jgi:ribose transport system ATP-binding protein
VDNPEPRSRVYPFKRTENSDRLSASVGHSTILRATGIQKSFPGVRALKGVDLDVRAGEVHALAGENGAGKSTLMHILAGVYRPDRGTLFFNGIENVHIQNEHHARQLGISIVYQERSLFDLLTVAENIFVDGQEVNRFGFLDRRALHARAAALLDQLGLRIDPGDRVERLSPAQQQMVEVAKALATSARLIIFDEPTASLSSAESAILFEIVTKLRADGVGIIYISHRLDEIFRLADRVTVLKDGDGQGTFAVNEITPEELISRMVGRTLVPQRGSSGEAGAPVLELAGVSEYASSSTTSKFADISFAAHGGEILAIAGLAGAGRSELAQAIFGLSSFATGQILLENVQIRPASPREAIEAGIGYVPEDRKQAGLFAAMSVSENISSARLDLFGANWTDDRKRDAAAQALCSRLRITSPGVSEPAGNLSGGNQQKVMLARWLLANPKVLIVDEPTRGIDVGARAEVYAFLRELADQGRAVIVISSDLMEIFAIADRILVMNRGRITGEFRRDEADEQEIIRRASASATEVPAR